MYQRHKPPQEIEAMGHPAFVAGSAPLQFTQRPIFGGRGARPGLPGKPHLFFKLQLLKLAQRDAELVGLSPKVGPVGRGLSGFFLFRLLNFLILHALSFYAAVPPAAVAPNGACVPTHNDPRGRATFRFRNSKKRSMLLVPPKSRFVCLLKSAPRSARA